MCTTHDSSNHFTSNLATELNKRVPKSKGCYFEGEKFIYRIDKGTNILSITDDKDIPRFRRAIKRHISYNGPPIGGYIVLENFLSGAFTNPRNSTGGVYFENCDYDRTPELFRDSSDSFTVKGLHAVCIVGWGIAENIQYAPGKVGDVPYWHARNSWGGEWGFDSGCFKIAMYPFNKRIQFDKRVPVSTGSNEIGGMILIKTTTYPRKKLIPAISETFFNSIKRVRDDQFYKQTPLDIEKNGPVPDVKTMGRITGLFACSIISIILLIGIIVFIMYRK